MSEDASNQQDGGEEEFVEPTPEQRREIILRARRELPELDRQFARGMENLDRISRGLRPIR